MYEKPTKADIEELCKVITEATSEGRTWEQLRKLSPSLKASVAKKARAVWQWHQERKALEEFL